MGSLLNAVQSTLVRVGIKAAAKADNQRLFAASVAPGDTQRDLLAGIIANNAGTTFGQEHNFWRVKTPDDFRDAVPVKSYEDLRPYIDCQEQTCECSLTAEQPTYYHRTSGTVGKPKDIPVTPSGLARIKTQQRISALAHCVGSDVYDGKVFAISGQAIEGHLPGGNPYGSASGLLYRNQPSWVRSRCVLSPDVADIEDYEHRYLTMAVMGLAEPNVSGIATANPSTLVKLENIINERFEELIEAIATGCLSDPRHPSLPHLLGPTANPNRAKQLETMAGASGRLSFGHVWPNLKGLVTWTGGSCGVPLERLRTTLPEGCRVIELGYVASEVRGTVNVDVQANLCLPTLVDTFFEFVERDRWEAENADFLLLDELTEGREYYVFVTTPDGLYRYDMNDIVRVTGILNATPTLEFVQKGKGVTSITGEKLYEAQVLDSVLETLAKFDVVSDFFIVLANQETAGYTLYVEAEAPDETHVSFATSLDERLRGVNIEYNAKRSSGRLSQISTAWLRPGTGDAYRTSRIAAGQRDAQFKFLHLQYAHECSFAFDAATIEERA